jgi:hypothetical protein
MTILLFLQLIGSFHTFPLDFILRLEMGRKRDRKRDRKRKRNMIDKYTEDCGLPNARRILPRLEIMDALEVVSRYLDTLLDELQR